MSTSPRLVQLPNGDWINPTIVASVSVEHDIYGKARVAIGTDTETLAIECATSEAAQDIRDRIASLVNGGDA
jgi:DNA-directed RNA polymerase subunit L